MSGSINKTIFPVEIPANLEELARPHWEILVKTCPELLTEPVPYIDFPTFCDELRLELLPNIPSRLY